MTGPLASDRPPSSAREAGLRPGDLIAGKYKIERILGKGGVGVVVAARDTQLQRPVAVKFLRTRGLAFPGAKERFLREAQAAVAIHSEHVARVIEFGTLDSGAPFIVMEYLTGIDLGDLLERGGALPVAQAVDYVLQACEAIAEAHSLGIIHRDLKPPNLFLAERPDGTKTVKVVDFGLSTAPWANADGKVDALTSTTMVAGSPHFMSPEQVRSLKHVDVQTDVWALGVILYQLVSDALPFDADAVTGIIAKILTDPPVALSAHRPDLPPGFEEVVHACFEKNVERRTGSIAALALALEPYGPPTCRLSVESIVRLSSLSRPSFAGPTDPPPALKPDPPALATTQLPVEAPGTTARPPSAETANDARAPAPLADASTTSSEGERAERAERAELVSAPSRRARHMAALLAAALLLPVGGLFVLRLAHGESPEPVPAPPMVSSSAQATVTATPSDATTAPTLAKPAVTPEPPASALPEGSASSVAPRSAPSALPSARPFVPAAAASTRAGTKPPKGKDDPLDHWQ